MKWLLLGLAAVLVGRLAGLLLLALIRLVNRPSRFWRELHRELRGEDWAWWK